MDARVREVLMKSSLMCMVLPLEEKEVETSRLDDEDETSSLEEIESYPPTILDLTDMAWGNVFQCLNLAHIRWEGRRFGDPNQWDHLYSEAVRDSVEALYFLTQVLFVYQEPWDKHPDQLDAWHIGLAADVSSQMTLLYTPSASSEFGRCVETFMNSVFLGDSILPIPDLTGPFQSREQMELLYGQLTLHEMGVLSDMFGRVWYGDRDEWPFGFEILATRKFVFLDAVESAQKIELSLDPAQAS